MKEFSRVFPWLVVGAAVLYLIYTMTPIGDPVGSMHVRQFGEIAVQDRGRIKPFDSVARTTLMLLSGRQDYKDENDKMRPAVQWALDVICHKTAAPHHKVFRIENDQVLALLGLSPRSETHFRYSLDEFGGRLKQLEDKARDAGRVAEKDRDVFHVKVLELFERLRLFQELWNGTSPRLAMPVAGAPIEQWRTLEQVQTVRTDSESLKEYLLRDPSAAMMEVLVDSYKRDDAETFNMAIDAYRRTLTRQFPAEASRVDFEAFYNHFEPNYQCALLYVTVFLLCCLAWFSWSQPFNRAAFWLAVLTVLVHTWALLARMYLSGRWGVFVTNLYSSAVFIGWGSIVLCLALEWLFHNGVNTLTASVLGALTMLIAHHLAVGGDTLEMMRAVLDTNFWLATHVTCVTLGYTATFVAGFLGLVYLVRGVLTPSLNAALAKELSREIYGVVCFATLLSFTGTVLGGIWADQSWGRFWGWDPKENGALLIVIWNALILHARWGGMVKQRGMAMLAVVGNMVTGWSWFGTNQLGVGLHAYGFNNTLATGLVIFWGSQMAAIIMGMLPLHRWASYQALTATPRPVAPSTPPSNDKPGGKRRGKRRGDAGYFPGPA